MNYQFSKKSASVTPDQIWSFLQNGLSKDVIIKSVQHEIPYNIDYIDDEVISFTAESRNDGNPEFIKRVNFEEAVMGLLKETKFNTSVSADIFRKAGLYKKRSPVFALLISAGIIEIIE